MEWIHNLNTEKARQMAEHRMTLMTAFIAQARREVLQPDA
jgi:hypothetical protein